MTSRTPLLRITMILGALHALLGYFLLPALQLPLTATLLCALVLLASTMLMPMTIFARAVTSDNTVADRLSWAGSICMGFFSSLFVLALLREALLLWPATRAHAQASALLVLALALLATVIGFVNARRVARVRRVDVPIAGLPPALHGYRIVQLSDIHVGATIKRRWVEAMVARANGLQADLIAITGDVVDGTVAQLGQHTAPLGTLAARDGVFLVTGNHEYYAGAAPWVAEFRRLGLRVLMNEHVVIEHAGSRLVLAGVTDYSAGHFDPAQASDPQRAIAGAPDIIPRILLAHQPRTAPSALAAGFDLQLSGHTHGGQFWPWNLFVPLQQPYVAGLHKLETLSVYVSRGTGYWGPPKRIGAPAEITLLRLVAASDDHRRSD
ncbi:metallophosphoesterase [Janthinobacterium aquaticum]|uniref:metallophosphoesterase n=1 Tax=Janthinobacterium sp. FT58W TaxID=2654254 RepID=UPI001264127A|nr:metallophosphoesterase [Janthinobacterium sp. FT58W]KAB8038539.1 metallophosphoesterase [Janthinobacterium sp. FT58W]